MPTNVTVKVYFEAAHRLHNPEKPDDWNREVYGKCNNPHGHGHNYVLEVSVEGEPDAATGYLIDMKDLKEILRRTVVNDVDHRHLNLEVAWLSGINPTSENLARVFFERIESELPEEIRLAAVTVHETERNSAMYRRTFEY
jgi:6-pyruvoyltetrahydropterin/6-carboxytetrahydropterin synthase